MKTSRSFGGLALLGLVLGILGAPVAVRAAPPAAGASSFVLVHGALFTGAGWNKLKSALNARGLRSVSLDLPGRAGDGIVPSAVSLQTAARKVCDVALAQPGPVILVGHSQGGVVIEQALGICGEKVKALAYIAAVAPLEGEIGFQALGEADTGFGKVATLDPEAKVFRVNRAGPVHEIFFADVTAKEAKRLVTGMVDEPAGIGTVPMTTPAATLAAIPKHYLLTTKDRVITPGTQERIVAHMPGMKVDRIRASHCPFLSKPAEVAAFLKRVEVGTR